MTKKEFVASRAPPSATNGAGPAKPPLATSGLQGRGAGQGGRGQASGGRGAGPGPRAGQPAAAGQGAGVVAAGAGEEDGLAEVVLEPDTPIGA